MKRNKISYFGIITRTSLQSRVGVLDEHLKVGLVPLAGLGRRLVRILLATEGVVAGGAGVAGTVRFTSRLDPDEGVSEVRVDISSGTRTEAGIDDVAPVTPLETASRVSRAASVDNGVVGHASRVESRTEQGNVLLLVLGLIPLSIVGVGELTGLSVPLVPAGDVGGETTQLRGVAGVLVSLGELLSTGLEVVVPAEPAAVASVHVHDDIGQVELLQGVGSALVVAVSRVLAGLEVGVGDEVGERVGLDDERKGSVGVLLEDPDNGWLIAKLDFVTFFYLEHGN